MNLLQHGVDRSVIAMWLGHESMDTTQMYLHANIELKEKAMPKRSDSEVGAAGFLHPTSCWPSCRRSDYAELRNRKRGDPPMILKDRPGYSALSGATENSRYAELGTRGTSTTDRYPSDGVITS
jgi:hypothetical protein